MIEKLLEEASRSDTEKRVEIVRRIALYPEEALKVATSALKTPGRPFQTVAIQVIRAIGYPNNASAIPLLVASVGNKNFAAWYEAVTALVDIGPSVVVPYLIQDMWNKNHHEYWGEDVEGICQMLCIVDREYAVQCGPVITHILGRQVLPPPHDLERSFLLDVLEKIGPACAIYALPMLIDFANKEGTSEDGRQARRLINSFSEETRAPYALVLASLEETTEPNASN